MQDQPSNLLDSDSIDEVLRLLTEFLASDQDCIRADALHRGEGGKCNLDGKHFCDRFADFLKGRVPSVPTTLMKLEHILVLSRIVRNGGVKAMMYRLETGCRSVVNDYLDDICQRLHLHTRQYVSSVEQSINDSETRCSVDCMPSAASLLSLLQSTQTIEEEQVAGRQQEINALLIEISRRLDGNCDTERTTSALRSKS